MAETETPVGIAHPESPRSTRGGGIIGVLLGLAIPLAIYPGLDPFERPKLIVATAGLALLALTGALRIRSGQKWLLAAVWIAFAGALVGAILRRELPTEWWGSEAGADGVYALGLGALILSVRFQNKGESVRAGLLAGTVLTCLYAIAQRCGFDPIQWSANGLSALTFRPFGTLGNPTFLGMQICLVLPIAVLMAREESAWRRRMGLCAAVVLMVTLGLTMSRVGILCGFAVLMLIWVLRQRVDVPALSLSALALSVGIALSGFNAPTSSLARFQQLQTIETGSAGVRQQLWRAGAVAASSPSFLGFGPKSVPAFLQQSKTDLSPKERTNPSFHNLLFDSLHQRGLVGLFALLLFFASLPSVMRTCKPGAPKMVLTLSLVTVALHAAVAFVTVGPWLTFCLLVGGVLDWAQPLPSPSEA